MGHARAVLVLNASYEPLNITTWRRAMVMLLKGKAEGLEHDASHPIRPDLLRPTVIRLRQFVRVPYKPLPLTRRHVLQRDGHVCQYCGFQGEPLSVDHVLPRSRGGADVWENVARHGRPAWSCAASRAGHSATSVSRPCAGSAPARTRNGRSM